MPNIEAPELIIILVIALLILGPGKLPEVGASVGKAIREFRKASADVQESMQVDTSPLPPPAAAPTAVDAPVTPPPTPPVTPIQTTAAPSSEPTPGTH